MVNLIKRDIILQKKLLIFFVPFIIFFIYLGASPFLTLVVSAFYIPFNALAYDEQTDTDKLLNSLPYKRKEIIASRYVGTIIFMLVSFILVALLMFMFNESFSVNDILMASAAFLVFVSITFPLFHIFEQGNISTIIIIVFIVSIILLNVLSELLMQFPSLLELMNDTLFISALTIGSLIIYGMSWMLSYRLYLRKNF